jgi:hypothetical protein
LGEETRACAGISFEITGGGFFLERRLNCGVEFSRRWLSTQQFAVSRSHPSKDKEKSYENLVE